VDGVQHQRAVLALLYGLLGLLDGVNCMARFLIGFAFVSMLLCAGGISLARSIGAARPTMLSQLFTAPDGSPCECLLGIIPGETSFEEGVAILDSHPLLAGQIRRVRGAGSEVQYLSRDTILLLAGDLRGGVVTIQLQAYLNTEYLNVPSWAGKLPSRVSLGDVIAAYDGLNRVVPIMNETSPAPTGVVRILFPERGLTIVTQGSGYGNELRLRPDSSVTFFSISGDTWYTRRWEYDLASAVDWIGFASLPRYTHQFWNRANGGTP
jgi:hypothetical protein